MAPSTSSISEDSRDWHLIDMGQEEFIELIDLQSAVKSRIGHLEQWVRVEIESHSVSRGHHYLGLIQKAPDGDIIAKARGTIWYSRADIIEMFREETGQSLSAGLSVVVLAQVEYHPVYGISLNITDIDTDFSIGLREQEKRKNIERLEKDGHMEMQKELALSYLPGKIAIISSETAAGYGDFVNHLAGNEKGFRFDCTLFNSLMQGEKAAESMIESLYSICEEGLYDVILIFRGGGADSDLFCFDDYQLAKTIAECPIPVLTAIGHERDYHIADMVAHEHFKTPTALADFIIAWMEGVEEDLEDSLYGIQRALEEKIRLMEKDAQRCITGIRFALSAIIGNMENKLALAQANINAADPRRILNQGYVLAVDSKGGIIKNAGSKEIGESFFLRFKDGSWNCQIKDKQI